MTGTAVASGLTLECRNQDHVLFSDGCLMLLPGEEISLEVTFTDGATVPLFLSGFGVPYHRLEV